MYRSGCEWKDKKKRIVRFYVDISEELALKILQIEKGRFIGLFYKMFVEALEVFFNKKRGKV